MKLIKKIIHIILIIAVFLLLPTVVFTLVTSKTNIITGIQSFVVLSGSMEPNVSTGSVIYAKPVQNYSKGDIIAFKQADKTVTHRIVDMKDAKTFVTKGDANDTADNDPVSSDKIIGKQVFSIPYLGFFIVFLSTPQGFFPLIILPITVFMVLELWNLKKEIEEQIEKKLSTEKS